jgi:hypothetical protein
VVKSFMSFLEITVTFMCYMVQDNSVFMIISKCTKKRFMCQLFYRCLCRLFNLVVTGLTFFFQHNFESEFYVCS